MTKKTISKVSVADSLANMTQEQIIALLGDKFQVIPKVDESKLNITYGEYKGKAMIQIVKGKDSFVNRPLNLSVNKCKLIIEALDEIKAFVKTNGKA